MNTTEHDPRHDPSADPATSFYHWTSLEGRLEELNNRLAAWYVSGHQLPELFDLARGNLEKVYDEVGLALDAPANSILRAFEDALDSYDNILANFPEEVEDPDDL